MKKTYKIIPVFYFLFLSFVIFAQDAPGSSNGSAGNLEGDELSAPGQTNGTEGNLEGNDVPIDKNLWIVLFLGIGYSFYLVKKNRKIEN